MTVSSWRGFSHKVYSKLYKK